MKKRYYIESKFRFTAFITIMILLTSLCINGIFNFNGVYADAKENTVEDYIDEEQYQIIRVNAGDTLWEIAEKYSNSNMDIRKAIYEISDLNNLETSELIVGQELLIPEL